MFLTDQTDPDIPFLEAWERGRARAELRIAAAKDSGLRNLPFSGFAANQAWLQLVLVCQDLVASAQTLLLTADLQRAEAKRLRFTLWHQAGTPARTGRRTFLRLQASWPLALELAQAFQRFETLPLAAKPAGSPRTSPWPEVEVVPEPGETSTNTGLPSPARQPSHIRRCCPPNLIFRLPHTVTQTLPWWSPFHNGDG